MQFVLNSLVKKKLVNINKLSKKKLVKVAKLSFGPEQAKITPTLAQLGISSMEFCERFNYQTRGLDKDLIVLVKLNVFSDKSFSFSLKPFVLKDLVLSYDLDLSWLLILKYLRSLKTFDSINDESKFNSNFFLSLYRVYLIYNNNLQTKNFTFEQFLKVFFSYLKSYNL